MSIFQGLVDFGWQVIVFVTGLGSSVVDYLTRAFTVLTEFLSIGSISNWWSNIQSAFSGENILDTLVSVFGGPIGHWLYRLFGGQ
jgi:hypothetical protein